MKTVVTFPILLILTAWIVITAIRIEQQNARAGYFLPRTDMEGKWRMSALRIGGKPIPSARDELREMVNSIGIYQYVLAPAAAALGLIIARNSAALLRRGIALLCTLLSIVCLGLAVYRGYFTSLGP